MSPMSTEVTETSSLKQSVAEEIRALLGRRNMSRLELAKRIGRSHTYMWRRLSGETAFDVDDLQKIAAVLGVSVNDLLPRNTFWKTREPLGERVVATVGEARIPRQRAHRPGRPVRQTRPVDQIVRPVTPVTAGR